jgi:hypothetical protein
MLELKILEYALVILRVIKLALVKDDAVENL